MFHYGLMCYYMYMYAHKVFSAAAGMQPVFSTAETDLWDMMLQVLLELTRLFWMACFGLATPRLSDE